MYILLSLPAFSAEVGVIFFGDAGTGGEEQRAVAEAISGYCQRERCDFVALLGDNFYPDGVASAEDPQWEAKFEEPYEGLGLLFRPTLGNHDHRGDPDAQIARSASSESWEMPARYYSFEVGPAAFFALDTEAWDRDQRRWLRCALRRSDAAWNIVYGHHPVYSYGRHGETEILGRQLRPLLSARADLYLAGHEHDMQVIALDPEVLYAVSGGGGAPLRPSRSGEGTLFARSEHGFGHLQIEGSQLDLRMISASGEVLFAIRALKSDDTLTLQMEIP